MIIVEPLFYAAAIPAVLLYGIAKGGFAAPLAILGVPLMALVISPIQAAAILLPILCIQDLISIYKYRGKFHFENLKILIPAATTGIVAGFLWFKYLSDDHIRIFLGLMAIIFVLNYWLVGGDYKKTGVSLRKGAIWGSVSGFTSFGIHAGGLPFSIYMLPQKLDHRIYVGTSALFFGVINFIKLFPYYYLDQLVIENILTATILLPFAPLGFFIGYYLTHRIEAKSFYSITYFCLMIIGIKLLYDGVTGL
ncbi:MAG: sulfite exporter TauE/SafE family protein [SAR86 cluster bacterium]|nr:sulfite exporter TauE/SafE family protein [SAR86 cluster bacterium]